jgi:hypothetical protein
VKDDLERETVAFQPADLLFNDLEKDDEEEEEDDDLKGEYLNKLLRLHDLEAANGAGSASTIDSLLQSYSLHDMRGKGVLKCGYESLVRMNMTLDSNNVLLDFQQPSSPGHNDPGENETSTPQESNLQMPPGR